MAKRKFYAVRVGKVPGIYQTWSQAEEQVKGFSGAEYKSFSKLEEPEGQYKDYIIIRDRFTLKILKIIEGIGLLLDDGNTSLIY